MTGWSEIISTAMLQIDDVRLNEQLAASPAQFFRRMSLYLLNAMPMLNRPPELAGALKNSMCEARFADYEWQSDDTAVVGETVTVETGITGFELCSVTARSADGYAERAENDASYDKDTGTVTFTLQENGPTDYSIDFYTDGTFEHITPAQERLFALAIAVVWDERFSRNWLNMQMKIKDSSFETVNESNYTEKITDRLMKNKQAFHDELRRYEQLCAYANVMPEHGRKHTMI